MHVHFLDTVLRPYFYKLATSKREMDASLNVIGHRNIYIFKKMNIYFLSPKRKMGSLQKEKRKKGEKVPGCLAVGEQVCAGEWASGELGAFKRD